VDPVPDTLLLRKSVSAGNRTRTSGSVARNSDHYITEAVEIYGKEHVLFEEGKYIPVTGRGGL
jgi:hypothetical protein